MSGPAFYVRETTKTKHPFLRSIATAPNQGDPVDNIAQLKEKQIQAASTGLLVHVPPSRFRFQVVLEEEKCPVTNDWSLLDIATKYPPFGWEPLFQQSLLELELKDKELQVWDYYPEKKNIFRVFEECPFDKVRVVILGQDPYHNANSKTGEPLADGFAFSSQRGNPIPPSLQAIFKEIRNTIGDVNEFTHPDLTKWVKQGVFLLNTALTVEKGKPNSHSDAWSAFTRRTIKYINDNKKKCIYILLGAQAQKFATGSQRAISQSKRVLMAGHPSPINRTRYNTFFNKGLFAKVNEILREDGEVPIDWNND